MESSKDRISVDENVAHMEKRCTYYTANVADVMADMINVHEVEKSELSTKKKKLFSRFSLDIFEYHCDSGLYSIN